jgi:hypothetical protein
MTRVKAPLAVFIKQAKIIPKFYLAGEKDALRVAADLSKQSTAQLASTVSQLKAITSSEKQALKAISGSLGEVKDFATAFERARIQPNSPIGKLVNDARQKGAEGLLMVCSDSVEGLLSADRPMARVYRTVANGESPPSGVVWAAMAQWNETLDTGRLIASVFATAQR